VTDDVFFGELKDLRHDQILSLQEGTLHSGATLLDELNTPVAMPGEDIMEELDVWSTYGEDGIDVTDGLLEDLEALLFEDDGGCFDVFVVHGASQSRVAFTLLIVMVTDSMS
jgi:hypothetical protein